MIESMEAKQDNGSTRKLGGKEGKREEVLDRSLQCKREVLFGRGKKGEREKQRQKIRKK